jgi:hypothetical protein
MDAPASVPVGLFPSPALTTPRMNVTDLRVALFTGNYNYVRDGANQALNRLVGYLLAQGASVRIYSPRVERPAFPSVGKVIGIPAVRFPDGPNIGCRC